MLSRIAWWLQTFWSPFWRFLVWGNSKREGIRKVLTLVLAVGVPSLASLWESPAYLYLHALNREIVSWPIRFGVLISVIIGFVWIVFAAGRAFELAGIPELVVAEELELDYIHFRLKLLSKRKDFKTKVRLMRIFAGDVTPLMTGRFPLELEWTHHPGESDIQLTADFEESVSVAALRPKAFAWVDLAFTGARHEGEITVLNKGESVYFLISVQHPTKLIERWFRFERVSDTEFETFPEAPPAFMLQANPSLS